MGGVDSPVMERRYESEREVAAPVERAWAVLADRDRYGEWNPFVRRLHGPTEVGARWFANVKPPRARGMLFHPRLVTWQPPQELAFRGQLVVPGLFDGLYRFEVVDGDEGRARLRGSLTFSGRLVWLLPWKTGAHMGDGIASMVDAWAERIVTPPSGAAARRP